MRKVALILLVVVCQRHQSLAQSLSINVDGSVADSSAILDVKSNSKGFLLPRMTKAERNNIYQPATGLLVFQTGPDSIGFHYYGGSGWLWLPAADSEVGWSTTGNGGTDSALHFLGTTDSRPIMLRHNNNWMGQLNPAIGSYFIGKGAGRFNNGIKNNVAMGDSSMANNSTGGDNVALGYYSQKGKAGLTTGSANTSMGARALMNLTTGGQNIAVGHYAMASMESGSTNVVLGAGAMESATEGNANIAMGLWALRENQTSSNNIAIGSNALYTNKRDNNIAIGIQAGYLNNHLQTNPEFGTQNIYIGYQSGYFANTGNKNVAVGFGALRGPGFVNSDDPTNTYYKKNVAIGDSAMINGYGLQNVAVGFQTLASNALGSSHVAVGFQALSVGSNGFGHVAVGTRTLTRTTASYPNTAIGYYSMDSVTTGYANTAVGSYSLGLAKTGINNTAIGNAAMYEAGGANSNLNNNTAIGNNSMRKAKLYGQVAVGAESLTNDTTGTYNTAVGYYSMNQNASGAVNAAFGVSSLRNNATGEGNTAIGANTMFLHKEGNYNTAVGYESMFFDSAGVNNTAMGWRSLRYAKRGQENTAIGVGAIEFTDSARYNTAVGRGAMISRGGLSNTAIGWYASSQSGRYVNRTTAIGASAGRQNYGDENTFVGYNSGYGAGADSLLGIENTGLGAQTLVFNTSGKSNTALGMGTLYGNTTGNGNVAVGTRALANQQAHHYNIAIGDSSMYGNHGDGNVGIGTFTMRFNNTGSYNVAAGHHAMLFNNNGSHNVAIGDSAMYFLSDGMGNAGIGTKTLYNSNSPNANYNSALGYYALGFNYSGARNTAVGDSALSVINSGSHNTGIGYMANTLSSAATNATAIGAFSRVDASNSMVLGSIDGINGATSDTKVGIGTTTPDSLFSVANNFMVNKNGSVQFANGVDEMVYMFKTPSTSTTMILAHSPSFKTWGLQYQDNSDKFNFLANGTSVMTVDLQNQRVGIGNISPAQDLHVGTTTGAAMQIGSGETLQDFGSFTIGSNSNLVPVTDNLRSLGTAANRWVNVFATTGVVNTSDARDKTNIRTIDYGINEVMRLKPVKFDWKNGQSEGPKLGFLAQELLEVIPEVVKTREDVVDEQGVKKTVDLQRYGVYYSDIIPVAVKAIQEQQKIIEDQQKQLDDQKKLIEALLKRVEKLENK